MYLKGTRWLALLMAVAICASLLTMPVMAAAEPAETPAPAAEDITADESPAADETPLVNVIEDPAQAETPSGEEETPAPDDAGEPEPETPVSDEPAEEDAEPAEIDGAPSGGSGSDEPKTFKVSYYSGTTLLAEETVAAGGAPANAPAADGSGSPVKAWLDAAGAVVTLSEAAISADIAYYAWFAPKLKTEEHARYINGIGNAQFGPTAELTRAQAATIIYNLLASQEKGPFNSAFSDVSSGAWYTDAVMTLASCGVINGYSDGTFRPNNAVSRAEFVTMLVNLTGVQGGSASFTDVGSHWAKAAIAAAAGQGWINGYQESGGTYAFRPNNRITRAEAVVVMNRVLGRSADKNTLATGEGILSYIDVKTTDWWYADVMEASIAHKYTKSGGTETWTSFTIESLGLKTGVQQVAGSYVYVDKNGQIASLKAGINKVDDKFLYAAAAGYAVSADLSSKPGYAVFTGGAADQALTDGFNMIGSTLFYWELAKNEARAMAKGLNTLTLKDKNNNSYTRTYWADEAGYTIRNDFGKGVVTLGGKKYLSDGACAIITTGLAYTSDSAKPSNTDLRNKTFEYEGAMYYVKSDYSLASNEWVGYLYFGSNGKYTSGDSELDGYVNNIVKSFVDNNALTRVQKLLKAYYHLRGGEGSNFVDNGFKYLPVGNIFTYKRYNQQYLYQDFNTCAKQMFTKNYGRCYEWGAGYSALARRLGFQDYLVVGELGDNRSIHCWNMIQWDGRWHISDVEIEWGWLSGHYGGGLKLYRNLFEQTLSSESVTYYKNPECGLVYYFPY